MSITGFKEPIFPISWSTFLGIREREGEKKFLRMGGNSHLETLVSTTCKVLFKCHPSEAFEEWFKTANSALHLFMLLSLSPALLSSFLNTYYLLFRYIIYVFYLFSVSSHWNVCYTGTRIFVSFVHCCISSFYVIAGVQYIFCGMDD